MSYFQSNLAALQSADPALAQRLATTPLPDAYLPTTARDGTPSFARTLTLADGTTRIDWLGNTALPAATADAITAILDPKSADAANGLALGVGTGHAWAAFLLRLSNLQALFLYDSPGALRLALDVCDLSHQLAARKLILLTGSSAEAAHHLAQLLTANSGIEPPTVLHPLPTLGGIAPDRSAVKNAQLAAGEQIVRHALQTRQELLNHLGHQLAAATPPAGVPLQHLAFLLTERYPHERPLHTTLSDTPSLTLDTPTTVSPALRLQRLIEALRHNPVHILSDLFRPQLATVPPRIAVETWVPPLVGPTFWDRLPPPSTLAPGDRIVVHSASHRAQLLAAHVPEAHLAYRPIPIPKPTAMPAPNPLALRHRVALLGDLPRIHPDVLGIVLPTQQALYAALRDLLSQEFLTASESIIPDLYRRAAARAQIAPAQANDPTLSGPMIKLLRQFLLPTVPLLAHAKHLVDSSIPLLLVGDWPERDALPANACRLLPFHAFTADSLDDTALLLHLSPTGVFSPLLFHFIHAGIPLLSPEHPTDPLEGSLAKTFPTHTFAHPRPQQLLPTLKHLLRDPAARGQLAAAARAHFS